MEAMLTEQVGLIEECCAELLSVDVRHDTAGVAITESLGQLMSMGHRLRDAIAQATVEIVSQDGKLAETDPQCRRDEQTGLQNRLGVEWQLDNWAHDDARREQALSAVLVDIDRFGALNSRLGTRVGERLLLSLAGFLEQLASGEEPVRTLYRYGGQSFFLADDDCLPQDLLPRVEKIRQSVAAAQWDHDGELHSLTVRCAIARIGSEEGVEAFCRRLEGLVQVAREAGGNCICLEDGAGPTVIQPEPVTVDGQVIKVE
jgi:diguanylate cyclase